MTRKIEREREKWAQHSIHGNMYPYSPALMYASSKHLTVHYPYSPALMYASSKHLTVHYPDSPAFVYASSKHEPINYP